MSWRRWNIIVVLLLALLLAMIAERHQAKTVMGNRRHRRAWVVFVGGNSSRHYKEALVTCHSLQQVHTGGEIVLVSFDATIERRVECAARELGIRLLRANTPPVKDAEVVSRRHVRNKEWQFYKLYAYSMIEYAKVVALDTDVLFIDNADELLFLPDGSHADGPNSPLNAGLVVIEPNISQYERVRALARSASGMWRDDFVSVTGDTVGFFGDSIDQGLLMHWIHVDNGARSISPVMLPREVYNSLQQGASGEDIFMHKQLPRAWSPKIVHFTGGCNKPSDIRPGRGERWLRGRDEWTSFVSQRNDTSKHVFGARLTCLAAKYYWHQLRLDFDNESGNC